MGSQSSEEVPFPSTIIFDAMFIFRRSIFLVALFLLVGAATGQSYKFAVLKYRGGGDWYANPTSLPNLIEFCNDAYGMDIAPEPAEVEVGSQDLFNYPFVHMTGHGNVIFDRQEAENLRRYLKGGGFLHIDDNYGMDRYIKPQLEKVFPDKELVELPFKHPLYHQRFDFDNGPPKIHKHDGERPRGLGYFHEGRLVLYYTYEADLGDGWEDPAVHEDPPEKRKAALRMGANLVQYVMMGAKEEEGGSE